MRLRRLMLIVIGLLVSVLPACSGGASRTKLSSSNPTSQSPSDAASLTLSLPPSLPDADKSAIEQVVRDYLDAFIDEDTGRSARERRRIATGDLRVWMTWLLALPSTAHPSGNLDIKALEVTGLVAPDAAVVDFDAEATFKGGEKYHLSGPALVKKVGGAWKVADYQRDGRSQIGAVFTNPKGSADKGSVTIKTVGVVLQDNYIDVVVQIANHSDAKVDFYEVTLVDSHGNQFSGGVIGDGSVRVVGHASLTTDFYWQGKSLPLTTKRFRLSGTFAPETSFTTVDYEFIVRLAG